MTVPQREAVALEILKRVEVAPEGANGLFDLPSVYETADAILALLSSDRELLGEAEKVLEQTAGELEFYTVPEQAGAAVSAARALLSRIRSARATAIETEEK